MHREWSPHTAGCTLIPDGCWCFHVEGSPVKRLNPDAWKGEGVLAALNPQINSQKGGRRERMAAARRVSKTAAETMRYIGSCDGGTAEMR